jgi:hypothetical protein
MWCLVCYCECGVWCVTVSLVFSVLLSMRCLVCYCECGVWCVTVLLLMLTYWMEAHEKNTETLVVASKDNDETK